MGKIISTLRPQQPTAEVRPGAENKQSPAVALLGVTIIFLLVAGALYITNAAWTMAPPA